MRKQSGFTLIELMIVVAIIGVLAALAIYGVRRYLASAKTSEAKNTIGAISRGFRVPEVMEQSGAHLVDVGTTNRTRLADYSKALAKPKADVALVLKVHPSNYRVEGFVEDTPVDQLATLPVPVLGVATDGLSGEAAARPRTSSSTRRMPLAARVTGCSR